MRDGGSMSDARMIEALSELGGHVEFPPTPPLPSVSAALERERAAGTRRPFPGLALWSRRRLVAVVVLGLLALLGVAAAARLTIGAIEVRVQPSVSPSASVPPLDPEVLGDPLAFEAAVAAAGFEPALPAGPPPDEAYVVQGRSGEAAIVTAWRPSDRYPAIRGIPWGLVLIAFPDSDDETVMKTVERFEDVREATVDGQRAFWIPVWHLLTLETDDGVETLSVNGNVLIWEADGITYRLETSLGKAEAVAIAESMG